MARYHLQRTNLAHPGGARFEWLVSLPTLAADDTVLGVAWTGEATGEPLRGAFSLIECNEWVPCIVGASVVRTGDPDPEPAESPAARAAAAAKALGEARRKSK